jgi:hypothetical protein
MLQTPMNLTSLLIDRSPLLGEANWKRTILRSKESPQLRRFNLALLPRIDFTITFPTAAHKSSQTDQVNADEPHGNARSIGVSSIDDGDKS